MIYATDFGAVFDGKTDDSAALQSAINAAAASGETLVLPGRAGLISTELDVRGVKVRIVGTPGKTELRAGTAGMTMINAEETADTIYSPFEISGLHLNGAQMASYGLRARYRHHSRLVDMLFSEATEANVWEKDTWLSRRFNCRSERAPVGWQLEGSNHASSFYGCYVAGCSSIHWLIRSNGTAGDGNTSLLFSNCGASDGLGDAVVAEAGASANFVSCYLGENCSGATVRNQGADLTFASGTLWFGYTEDSYLFAPESGHIVVNSSARLHGQEYGSTLKLSQPVVGEAGTFRLDDVEAQMITGGDQILVGDVLGYGEQRQVLAPRLGRLYMPVANHTTFTATAPMSNSQRVTCTSVTGSNPIIGLASSVATDYRVGETFFLVLVYRASKALQVRVDQAVLGAPVAILAFPPASDTTATLIKLDAPLPTAAAGAVLDILLPAAAEGDYLEVSECFLADSAMVNARGAAAGRIFKC